MIYLKNKLSEPLDSDFQPLNGCRQPNRKLWAKHRLLKIGNQAKHGPPFNHTRKLSEFICASYTLIMIEYNNIP